MLRMRSYLTRPQLNFGVRAQIMDFEEFEATKTQFANALRMFRPTRAHLVPDLVLLGFLNELEENANITGLIATSDYPHRGFPNARAAFEAAQLALLLVTDSDYDAAGARAWLYYLRKDRLLAISHGGDAIGPDGLTPDQRFRAAVDEMASIWEDMDTGKGDVIRAAEPLVESQPRRPDNWAGVSIAPTLRHRLQDLSRLKGLPTPADAAAIYNSTYSILSRESHPRTRLRPTQIRGDQNGYAHFDFDIPDEKAAAENALLITSGALSQGYVAIGLRHHNPAL